MTFVRLKRTFLTDVCSPCVCVHTRRMSFTPGCASTVEVWLPWQTPDLMIMAASFSSAWDAPTSSTTNTPYLQRSRSLFVLHTCVIHNTRPFFLIQMLPEWTDSFQVDDYWCVFLCVVIHNAGDRWHSLQHAQASRGWVQQRGKTPESPQDKNYRGIFYPFLPQNNKTTTSRDLTIPSALSLPPRCSIPPLMTLYLVNQRNPKRIKTKRRPRKRSRRQQSEWSDSC